MEEKRVIDFRYAPDYNQTCIGFVDDPFKTIVREDGSINFCWQPPTLFFNGMSVCDTRIANRHQANLSFRYRYVPRFFHRDKLLERKQEFDDPRLAIVKTVEKYEHTQFEWIAFAYHDKQGLRADILLFRLAADETFGHAISNIYLQALGEEEGGPSVLATPIRCGEKEFMKGCVLHSEDVWEGAYAFVHTGSIQDFTLEFAKAALNETKRYWEELPLFRHPFHIPDAGVQGMLDSCARNILQAREIKDGVCEFHVGPTCYRGLWIVDGYFLNECGYIMGYEEEASQGLLALLRHVKPDGSIHIIPKHDKETGIALAEIVRHCELTDNDDKLRELWPLMLRALLYLRGLHDRARAMGNGYKGYLLFPPAFGDGGIGASGESPEYTTPCWILAGLKKAYEAGSRLQLPQYEEFLNLYNDVMAGFLQSAARDRKNTEGGIPYLPMSMVPDPQLKPQTGTWALAHAITPGEVFAPEHEIVQDLLKLLDSVDDREGIPEDTGWCTDQALWPYSSMFYAEVWLYANRPEKAVDYLYAFANHASVSRVWREEQPLKGSPSPLTCGDMPHNWASAGFIRLVRNLLVFEKRGSLELLSALPNEWLPKKGDPLVLTDTPTRYGKISLSVSCDGSASYTIKIALQPGCVKPEHLILHWKGTVFGPGIRAAGNHIWELDSQSNQWSLTAEC